MEMIEVVVGIVAALDTVAVGLSNTIKTRTARNLAEGEREGPIQPALLAGISKSDLG
jgi:hypothetical protein